MINKKGFYKRVNNDANNLKLRSILSIFVMGIFIFFGFASIEENPKVDCEFFKPPIDKTFVVTIEIYDKQTGAPIQGQSIKFDIRHYEKIIDSNFECVTEQIDSYTKTLNFTSIGKAVLILNKTFVSKDDEISVLFSFQNPNFENSLQSFSLYDYHSTNQTQRFGFLKKQIYP